MKKLIASILTLALLSLAAEAQTRYSAESLTVPTVYTDGAVSNDVNAKIDCRFQPDVALSISTAATNVVYRISSSVDNSSWKTNQFVIGIIDETVGTKVLVTNLSVKGIGWLRIDSVALTGDTGATNTVKFAIKRY